MSPYGRRNSPRILIAGAGIGGLTTALSLHAAGLDDVLIVEACPNLRAVGAGINLQPAAVRELTELGLAPALEKAAVATARLEYHHRYGGLIWSEPRGRAAGYNWPQYSVHRADLQDILLTAVLDRLGPEALVTGDRLIRYEQDQHPERGRPPVRAYVTDRPSPYTCDLLIGADGINSAVRATLYPDEGPPLGNGIRMWRGVTEGPAFLDGRTMVILGCNARVKAVAYPVTRPDESGRCLLNWVVESRTADGVGEEEARGADWDRAVPPEEVLTHIEGWRSDFLDLHAVIAAAPRIGCYPMIDRDPLPTWVDGRVVLLGDAAHPLYPTGSNGASQAVVDARVLAYELAHHSLAEALARYEADRRPQTAKLLAAHRRLEPDPVLRQVEALAPDGFHDIRHVLPEDGLDGLKSCTRQVTGVDATALNARTSWSVAV
ncbi:2-polyprenyl-6-methoxyphenol hydroxylase-like FAD-dependent oxidoreductase [Streptomyces sp. 2132.2]|uniref:flavin-dependent oxidoreductase n=1 Tax=Streptomyces TaxID=1883 RepID=UPI000F490F64|nr:flavin-dependent oxidoreductase [Streptomyces sp. 2132.2]ROQ94233.1 2-polyprenyl-6-methoxyphenol hydroxylase-like FAD-dependent oxidoreductase [Streptomyces sp. 2132.2]